MNLSSYKLLYLVEGETEQAVINVLKGNYIYSGKVKVCNPVTKSCIGTIRILIKKPTICILVFDKDVYNKNVANKKILENNIRLLRKDKNVKEVIVIVQENDLDDEIIRATSIKKIQDLLGSKSKKNAKAEIIKCTNLLKKLEDKKFNIDHFWSKGSLGAVASFV